MIANIVLCNIIKGISALKHLQLRLSRSCLLNVKFILVSNFVHQFSARKQEQGDNLYVVGVLCIFK